MCRCEIPQAVRAQTARFVSFMGGIGCLKAEAGSEGCCPNFPVRGGLALHYLSLCAPRVGLRGLRAVGNRVNEDVLLAVVVAVYCIAGNGFGGSARYRPHHACRREVPIRPQLR